MTSTPTLRVSALPPTYGRPRVIGILAGLVYAAPEQGSVDEARRDGACNPAATIESEHRPGRRRSAECTALGRWPV